MLGTTVKDGERRPMTTLRSQGYAALGRQRHPEEFAPYAP
jgi:hypothetical protein